MTDQGAFNLGRPQTVAGHLDDVVDIEKAAWPEVGKDMVADIEKFKTRIQTRNINMAITDGKPTGIISFLSPSYVNSATIEALFKEFTQKEQLMSWEHIQKIYGLPKDWYEATNDGYIVNGKSSKHNPCSDCLFLIGVGVDQQLKGNGIVNQLISHTLQQAKDAGKKFVIGYGRMPQLAEEHPLADFKTAKEHLLMEKKTEPGMPHDYGVRFHVRNCAKAVSLIPNAMDDAESLNYGFLAVYRL